MSGVTNIYEILSEDYEVKSKPKEPEPKKVEKKAPPPKEKPKEQATVKASKEKTPPAKNNAQPQEKVSDSPIPGKETTRRDKRVNDKKKQPDRTGGPPRGGKPSKRSLDRHSGTGRGKDIKKSGAGKGNWGTPIDGEVAKVEEELKEETAPAEGTEVPEEGEKPQEEQTTPPKEEEKAEEKTITLEEYKRSKKLLKPSLNLRKAGEGVDQSEWASYVPLKKEEDQTKKATKASEKKEKENKEANKKTTIPLQEIFTIQEEKRAIRGRGGGRPERKGSLRGDGKGRGKGSRSKPTSFSMTEESFPTLSKA